AKIVIAKILMEVSAGETEAAPAVRPFYRPGQDFFAPTRRDDVWIWAARRRRLALACFIARFRDENRRHALHVGTEADVVIPLINNVERPDPARDRMLGQALDVR